MVHGDLAGWHQQTLSLIHPLPQGLLGASPSWDTAPELHSSSPNPKLSSSLLSPLSAQTAEPSQDSVPEAHGYPLSGGVLTLRWEAAHGVTGEHWQEHQAPLKSHFNVFTPQTIEMQHDFLTNEPHCSQSY